MVRTPESGGDTIFTSQTALYDKLSPKYQQYLDGLHGVHSSEVSAQALQHQDRALYMRRKHELLFVYL